MNKINKRIWKFSKIWVPNFLDLKSDLKGHLDRFMNGQIRPQTINVFEAQTKAYFLCSCSRQSVTLNRSNMEPDSC